MRSFKHNTTQHNTRPSLEIMCHNQAKPCNLSTTPGELDRESAELERLTQGLLFSDPPSSSDPRKAKKGGPSSSRLKRDTASGSSSLSPTSQLQSPIVATHIHGIDSARASPSPSSSSLDSHQPAPAASIAQYQTFGPDPSTFDDPTIYHIREVMDGMTDDEKKDIYCVSQFPHNDLANLIAGTPPDKDFSNAKPTNQVNANTFAAYIEPYLHPLTEEDMAFLRERVRTPLPRYAL